MLKKSTDLACSYFDGLRFFGQISASVSHEFKNVLAIINENAGLMEDIILMEEKGLPLDPEKFGRLTAAIGKQVRRADGIVRNMNRFAHSADKQAELISINATLSLLIDLTKRMLDIRGVSVKLIPAADEAAITTNPFSLENLVWRCIDFTANNLAPGGTLEITVEKTESGARVRISSIDFADKPGAAPFPSETENALLAILEAKFNLNGVTGELSLDFPEKIV